MNHRDMDNIEAIERAGKHIGTGHSAMDYYILYGTGETKRREEDRAAWNRAVDSKKAKAKENKL
jgi:hypothetical protein